MLDDRKIKVLYAIIDSYIIGAEPIGSRTITKQYDIGVSSATIRNEMSDLEELGFLIKPYSSAGRIPSDKAYRLYVNGLLNMKETKLDLKKKNHIKDVLASESREIDDLLRNSAKILSALTSYTALAISPQLKNLTIKHVQLIPIDTLQILLILVSNTGVVKNSIIRLKEEIPENQVEILSNFLNEKLRGSQVKDINSDLSEIVFKEIYEFKNIIENIIPVINKSMEDISNIDLYSDGINKILNFPEYKDVEKAKIFMNFFEDKDSVVDILLGGPVSRDIDIIIGEENAYAPIKDCSLLTATYRLGDTTIGKIGVIGPTRMDYIQVINTLKLFSKNITELIDFLIKS
jgi:heat-inducible transcriptional repressor